MNTVSKEKRYLYRYKKNLSCIERLEDKLVTLDTRLNSVGSPRFSDMPKGSNPIPRDALIVDKLDLEDRIRTLKSRSEILRKETYAEIDKLGDTRYVEVLECLFIRCLDLDDTAEEMGYGRRHVQRLYKEAILNLVEAGE